MPGGMVRRALLFSTYIQRSRNEVKTGRVGKVYFAFGFSGLGVFCTGGGLDKGWRGALEVVQKENPLTEAGWFVLAMSQISGKRLTYAALTGKVPPSC